jgi:hypothetical protein
VFAVKMQSTWLRWFMSVSVVLSVNVMCDQPKLRAVFLVGLSGTDDTSSNGFRDCISHKSH